MLKTGLVVAN